MLAMNQANVFFDHRKEPQGAFCLRCLEEGRANEVEMCCALGRNSAATGTCTFVCRHQGCLECGRGRKIFEDDELSAEMASQFMSSGFVQNSLNTTTPILLVGGGATATVAPIGGGVGHLPENKNLAFSAAAKPIHHPTHSSNGMGSSSFSSSLVESPSFENMANGSQYKTRPVRNFNKVSKLAGIQENSESLVVPLENNNLVANSYLAGGLPPTNDAPIPEEQ